MPKEEMSDLIAMSIMAKKNLDIRMSNTIDNINSGKKKSVVTMQVDEATAQALMKGIVSGNVTHYIGLYVINKEQFEDVKSGKIKP